MKQPNPGRDLAAAQAKRKNPSLAQKAYGIAKDIYVDKPLQLARATNPFAVAGKLFSAPRKVASSAARSINGR